MKAQKITYWIATALFCAVILYSASMYFLNTEMIKSFFESYNYPTYIVIPLAIAKVLAVIMILWRYSKWLTEWAYAGIFFDLIFASLAHYHANDSILFPMIAMIFLLISYFFGKVVRY